MMISNRSRDVLRQDVYLHRENAKCGLVDKSGNTIIPCIYARIRHLTYYLFLVENKGQCGVYDIRSGEIVPCEYDKVELVDQEFIRVNKNDKWGYYNIQGKLLLPCIYDGVSKYYNGVVSVNIGGNFGVADLRGRAYFGDKADIAIEYYNRIHHEKTIIQAMIDNARNEKEALIIKDQGEKRLIQTRCEMGRAMHGHLIDEGNNYKEFNDTKEKSKNEIKWL